VSVRRRLVPLVLLVAVAAAALLWLRARGDGALHYTGFVEGEERVLRSEVAGRVVEVLFREGDPVPAGSVVARIDPSEIEARLRSKAHESAVLEAEIARQEQQVRLVDETWRHELAGARAALDQAQAEAGLAERDFARQQGLAAQGVTPEQRLDTARTHRDAAQSALRGAREALGRVSAQERGIALQREGLKVLRRQLELSRAQLAELQVLRDRHEIRAPATSTVVQTQLLWPGELAQPGTGVLAVLDPLDKYVQVYVPVADLARLRVGQRVEIELDSEPGRRVPGEVSFVADQANFTPEKIETRDDRMSQVYRAKVRILEDVERFQPGTEGNVYVVEGARTAGEARR
jgi:HlyD family secretion protein